MVRETGAIKLSRPQGRPRIIRTTGAVQKVSIQKRSNELDISQTTIRSILKNDLGYQPYKKNLRKE